MNGTIGIKKCEQTYTISAYKNGRMIYTNYEDLDEAREAYLKAVVDTVPCATLMKAIDDYHGCIDLCTSTFKLSDLLLAVGMDSMVKEAEYIMGVEFDVDIGYDRTLGYTFQSLYQDAVHMNVNLKAEDGTVLWIESTWNSEGYKYASDDEANAWVVKGDGETYRAIIARDPTDPLADLEEDLDDVVFGLWPYHIEGTTFAYEGVIWADDFLDYIQKCAELQLEGYHAFRSHLDHDNKSLDRVFIKESE